MLGKKGRIKDLLRSIKRNITLNCKVCDQEIDPEIDSYYFTEHTYFVKGKEHDTDGLFIHDKCFGKNKNDL